MLGRRCTNGIQMFCVSWDYPVNTKYLYNIYTMLDQRRSWPTLGRRRINGIQIFCVCWVKNTDYHIYVHVATGQDECLPTTQSQTC